VAPRKLIDAWRLRRACARLRRSQPELAGMTDEEVIVGVLPLARNGRPEIAGARDLARRLESLARAFERC
jgi:hypothetical protein